MIYLDNAATSQKKPKEVLEAVLHAMESMGNAGRLPMRRPTAPQRWYLIQEFY